MAIPGPRKASVGRENLPVTEQRNPRSLKLDTMTLEQGVELMLSEEARVTRVLSRHKRKISRAVGLITAGLRRGGRLFYVGAGTSGRLGVLDASECPPTFRTSPEMVQGIIAGGDKALRSAVEGAEDDLSAGAETMTRARLRAEDTVVGIAASGSTPFVWGALTQAQAAGAQTILVCFNPDVVIPRGNKPRVVIAPDLGPEVLTGSTRLKAGTATKLILNMFTTLAMVRLGKVVSNLMVDVQPSNQKLKKRAVRITTLLSQANDSEAERALASSQWNIKKAVAALTKKRRSPG